MRMRLRSRKYGNHKLTFGKQTFDSMKEYNRYLDLLELEREGKITDLQRQVKYQLIPAQYEQTDEVFSRGIHKGEPKRGPLIEREVAYFADFVYKLKDTGVEVVEDTKGMRTTDYIIKRKLMLWIHGIRIREI